MHPVPPGPPRALGVGLLPEKPSRPIPEGQPFLLHRQGQVGGSKKAASLLALRLKGGGFPRLRQGVRRHRLAGKPGEAEEVLSQEDRFQFHLLETHPHPAGNGL